MSYLSPFSRYGHLKLPLKIAAKLLQIETWLLLTVSRKSPPPCQLVQSPTIYESPFTHNTTWLAYQVTMVRYYPSRSSKINYLYLIWKPVCDFLLVINNNLGLILHRLAIIHPWQTDGRQLMPIARLLLNYGRLKTKELKKHLVKQS